MFVKPKPGTNLPFPGRNRLLNPEGEEVPNDSYWHRRLTDGDVVEAAPAKPAKNSKAQE